MLELCRANPALARSPMAEDCMPRPSASLAAPLFVPRPREIARRRSAVGQWKACASNAGENLGSPTTENWAGQESQRTLFPNRRPQFAPTTYDRAPSPEARIELARVQRTDIRRQFRGPGRRAARHDC